MPDWTQVRSPHVFKAIEECDRIGAKDFLGKYGFKKARIYTLWHRGNEYDSKAILGAAYLYATGRAATWDEFSGGEQGAAKVLTDLGFDVVAEKQPVAPTRTRKAAPARTRATAPEPVVRLCPRCHVAVPATGICDFCD
jgi:hypothetical protein